MKHLKTFEKYDENSLHFFVTPEELLENGYTCDNSEESRYKTYHKKINKNVDVRCWGYDRGKYVNIKDFQDNSAKVADFYMKHIYEEGNIKMSRAFKGWGYFPILLNFQTGEIIKKFDIVDKIGMSAYLESEYETSGDWDNIVFTPESWDPLIEELVFLTNGEIKDNPNYKTWKLNKTIKQFNI